MGWEKMVRVGTVTDRDLGARKARVKFPDEDLPSGWLAVLASPPFIPAPGPQRTEAASGGSGYAAFASHTHNLIIQPWMPEINDTVLVLYVPAFQGDGYILGRFP